MRLFTSNTLQMSSNNETVCSARPSNSECPETLDSLVAAGRCPELLLDATFLFLATPRKIGPPALHPLQIAEPRGTALFGNFSGSAVFYGRQKRNQPWADRPSSHPGPRTRIAVARRPIKPCCSASTSRKRAVATRHSIFIPQRVQALTLLSLN